MTSIAMHSWPTKFVDARIVRDGAAWIVAGASIPLTHRSFWRWSGVRFMCALAASTGAAVRLSDQRAAPTTPTPGGTPAPTPGLAEIGRAHV